MSSSAEQRFRGGCHCEALWYVYRTRLAPQQWSVRECQCRFCRAHAALSTSDPSGSLELGAATSDALQRYRFGQRSADFLLCRNCGVYVGAVIEAGGHRFGIINIRALQTPLALLPPPVQISYANESTAERRTRREKRWTPIAPATTI